MKAPIIEPEYRKVLMILYNFPPSNDVGMRRGVRFIKCLSHFGWYPIVLAPSDAIYWSYDQNLESTLGGDFKIYRSPFRFPFNFLLKVNSARLRSLHKLLWNIWNINALPDGAMLWLFTAIPSALRIIKDEKVDVVFVSGQPFSTFILAAFLKVMTNKKLVLDYRDPWTLNPFHDRSRLRQAVERRLEIWVLRHADAAIFTTEEMKEFQRVGFNGYFDVRKTYSVTNSYDETKVDLRQFNPKERFTILHAGNLYGVRNPESFLKALALIVKRDASMRKEMSVLFYGINNFTHIKKLCEFLDIGDLVTFHGRVSQKELLPIFIESSVFLLVNSYGPGHHIFIPAKFFDYLKFQKPILALSEEGALSRAVRETGSGIVVEPTDVDGIARAILTLYENRRTWHKSLLNDRKSSLRFESSYTSRQLAEVFDKFYEKSADLASK